MDNNKVFKVNKKSKTLEDDLKNLTKDELIEKIVQLRAHNSQLKNIIEKTNHKTVGIEIKKRKFDFTKAQKRHVLLKFLYCGWDYHGFANQEDTTATIEFHLFKALEKTCLIENREISNYNRCGRTDKEVSAFCQVISIDLRSKFAEEEQMKPENIVNEIEYCNMLNRVLPNNIKCISWMPLKSKCYSARFDCIERTYRYFFPKGNLNVEKMRLGCKNLIGTHDFRNLCKMDVGNGVVSFMRSIKHADIYPCQKEVNKNPGYDMFYLEITGKAFLWHQIRCIMAILMLIGEGNEDPSIFTELFDVRKNPCKPLYGLANGVPLNLYKCEFKEFSSMKNSDKMVLEDDIIEESLSIDDEIDEKSIKEKHTTEWVYNKENLTRLIETMQSEWSGFSIKKTMIREILNDLEDIYYNHFNVNDKIQFQANMLQTGVKQKHYQKLMNRKRCESLENRLEHYLKKQRLTVEKNNITSS